MARIAYQRSSEERTNAAIYRNITRKGPSRGKSLPIRPKENKRRLISCKRARVICMDWRGPTHDGVVLLGILKVGERQKGVLTREVHDENSCEQTP